MTPPASPPTTAPVGTPGNDALLRRADDDGFTEFLTAWLSELIGARSITVEPVIAGTRASWRVDAVSADGEELPVIVRQTRDTLQVYGDATRETAIYRALGPTPVPVPHIYGINTERGLVAAQRVAGTDDLSGLDPQTREAVSDDLMRRIADLHALDPRDLDLPAMDWPQTPEEHATVDIDHWQDFHRRHAPANPVVSYACQWLRRNASTDVRKTVLVQGDTGPGNFVQSDGVITAIVDWELSHLGDAYEDLGWVVARSLLFPFGDLTHRFQVYAQASGLPFDRRRIWHGAVSAMTKVLIAGDVVRARGHDDPQYPVLVSGPAMHGRLVIEAIHQLEDRTPEPVTLEPATATGSEQEGSLAFIRTTLRQRLLPALEDRYQIAQAKAALRTTRHLQQGLRYDAPIAAQEITELSKLLSTPIDAPGQGWQLLDEAIEAGRADDTATLAYLGRHVQRETIRMAELLGPMATTPLPVF